MSMITQCPSCATTFRVTPQQLQAQHGAVRCGRCATVFDGFKGLATLPEAPPPLPAPSTPSPATPLMAPPPPLPEPAPIVAPASPQVADLPPAPVLAAPEPEPEPIPEPIPQPIPEPEPVPESILVQVPVPEPEPLLEPEPAAVAPADSASIEEPAAVTAEPAPAIVELPLPQSAPSQTMAAAPPLVAFASAARAEPPESYAEPARHAAPEMPAPAASSRRAGWVFATLILLAALGAQYIYLYRGEIAAAVPEARPWLNDWCKHLRCTVALPQNPRQITIEASDMQAADAAHPGLVVLTATLRNQAATTLGFPALDVVLTNTREHTVARRIFLPAEYLTDKKDWRAGMPPSAEITIRLNIDSGDLGAAGFRLDLMAAPAS